MKRALLFHAMLLGIGLLAAQWSSPRPDDDESPVLLWDASQAPQLVRYVAPDREIVIERAQNDAVSTDVVTMTVRDGGAEPADQASRPLAQQHVFPAGKALQRSLKKLSRLSAQRSLGVPPPARLDALGLSARGTRLLLRGETELLLLIGKETFGGASRYVQRAGEDEVFVVDALAFKGFEGAPMQLMEARLFAAHDDAPEWIELRDDSKRIRFERAANAGTGEVAFVHAQKPEVIIDEVAALWARVSALRAMKFESYQEAGEKPALFGLTVGYPQDRVRALSLGEAEEGTAVRVRLDDWIAWVPADGLSDVVAEVRALLEVDD